MYTEAAEMIWLQLTGHRTILQSHAVRSTGGMEGLSLELLANKHGPLSNSVQIFTKKLTEISIQQDWSSIMKSTNYIDYQIYKNDFLVASSLCGDIPLTQKSG